MSYSLMVGSPGTSMRDDPYWSSDESVSTTVRPFSPIEGYFEATSAASRAALAQQITGTEQDIRDIVAYAVFRKRARNVDQAIPLLAQFGVSTISFATQFSYWSHVPRPVLTNMVWELIAQSLIGADDVDFDLRETFLRGLARESDPSVRFSANEALECLERPE